MEAHRRRAALVVLLPLLFAVVSSQPSSIPDPFVVPYPDFGDEPEAPVASPESPPISGARNASPPSPVVTPPAVATPPAPSVGGEGSPRRVGGGGASTRDFRTGYGGVWELFATVGVSAMHMAITNKNKAVIFDATNFGPSKLRLPEGNCRIDERSNKTDCFAHAFEIDIYSAAVRPLKVLTNPWCASGAFGPDGSLIQTGGWWDGGNAIRYLGACDVCDWTEHKKDLYSKRWYATQQILPDGGFIVIGGRREFNYEFVPPPGQPNKGSFKLPFLRETQHPELENNLYPFVHLSTDGNLFIFANNRSILFDPKAGKVLSEFPVLPGGGRNYPNSGMSALLPLDLNRPKDEPIPAEVMVCGGAPPLAAKDASNGTFNNALDTCARIVITSPNAEWTIELMPKPRIMADLLNLPTGDLLFVNGASKGAAGWLFARDPVFEPWLYSPQNATDQRFKVLSPSTIPRMYHSSSALLPDGKILIAGSNANNGYFYGGVMYPTELRIEKYSPPYLDPALAVHRPVIKQFAQKLSYGLEFKVGFKLGEKVEQAGDVKVTLYAPPFTTHGYSMNQRLLVLRAGVVGDAGGGVQQISVEAPASGILAPPGYYLLFVVHRGVPSKGVWVQIK